MGLFHEFVNDADVRLVGVEAAGKGVDSGLHAATLTRVLSTSTNHRCKLGHRGRQVCCMDRSVCCSKMKRDRSSILSLSAQGAFLLRCGVDGV